MLTGRTASTSRLSSHLGRSETWNGLEILFLPYAAHSGCFSPQPVTHSAELSYEVWQQKCEHLSAEQITFVVHVVSVCVCVSTAACLCVHVHVLDHHKINYMVN